MDFNSKYLNADISKLPESKLEELEHLQTAWQSHITKGIITKEGIKQNIYNFLHRKTAEYDAHNPNKSTGLPPQKTTNFSMKPNGTPRRLPTPPSVKNLISSGNSNTDPPPKHFNNINILLRKQNLSNVDRQHLKILQAFPNIDNENEKYIQNLLSTLPVKVLNTTTTKESSTNNSGMNPQSYFQKALTKQRQNLQTTQPEPESASSSASSNPLLSSIMAGVKLRSTKNPASEQTLSTPASKQPLTFLNQIEARGKLQSLQPTSGNGNKARERTMNAAKERENNYAKQRLGTKANSMLAEAAKKAAAKKNENNENNEWK